MQAIAPPATPETVYKWRAQPLGTAIGLNMAGAGSWDFPIQGATVQGANQEHVAARAGMVRRLDLYVSANAGAAGADFILLVDGAETAMKIDVDQQTGALAVTTPFPFIAGQSLGLRYKGAAGANVTVRGCDTTVRYT